MVILTVALASAVPLIEADEVTLSPAELPVSLTSFSVRIGVVPVGYGDGFRRGLVGTEVLVGVTRRRLVGRVSMDALTVELGDEEPETPVTLIGDGILAEEHARVLGTINYEITCGIRSDPLRADRTVLDG